VTPSAEEMLDALADRLLALEGLHLEMTTIVSMLRSASSSAPASAPAAEEHAEDGPYL